MAAGGVFVPTGFPCVGGIWHGRAEGRRKERREGTSTAGGATAGRPSVALGKRAAPPSDAPVASASVPAPDEASALREQLARHRRGVADLQAELEAERGAAAGAASEAMSMILRLQRDKSEAMMEARQYRRYAEERFAHDAAEVAALHDALDRHDAAVGALAARLRACQTRLLHLGF